MAETRKTTCWGAPEVRLLEAFKRLYRRKPYGTWNECLGCGATWWDNENEAQRHYRDCYAFAAIRAAEAQPAAPVDDWKALAARLARALDDATTVAEALGAFTDEYRALLAEPAVRRLLEERP